MNKWFGKVAVVTGAGSGIGAAIFKDLAANGLSVIGLDLCTDNSNQTSQAGKTHALRCDVTDKESVEEAFHWIKRNFGGVHVLVNNAGCGRSTTLLSDEDNAHKLRTVIDTNIFGMLLCTKVAFNVMKDQHEIALIVNINSIKGHSVPFIVGQEPNTNIYAGTKHAVKAATEVLRQELVFLKNEKIRISSISPGVVLTNFNKAAGNPPKSETMRPILNPADVSDAVMFLLRTKPHVNITELIIKPVGEPF